MPVTKTATDPNAQLRSALTSAVDAMLHRAAPVLASHRMLERQKGPNHPYIRLVNREAERLLKAFRASVREQVRALPGRAQKGAVDAAVRGAAPKVKQALNGRKAAS